MPIYEYKCSICGKTFEILQSISAEAIQKCIHCQGAVKKLFSATTFQFKGSGWYSTDYKQKPENAVKPDHQPKSETKDKKNASIN